MQYEPPSSLPQPDELSAEHSVRVRDHIGDKIRGAGGQISFAEFMHEALYAPGLGYYSAGATKFGPDGDFITAPEVSSIFGRILARQAAEVLCEIENGEILECGAGSGKLAEDILIALDELDAMPAAYNILEVSADLANKQQQRLRYAIPQFFDRIRWLSSLPQDFDGVIIANEVLDALPVERFVQREAGPRQLNVSLDDEGFIWKEVEAPARLKKAVAEIESDLGEALADGYVSEVSLAAPLWIDGLGQSLRQGAIFLFDYGISRREYYAADRSDGWLRCHFRHRAHNDPLIHPGIQDLTAWVDFSSIAGAAVAAGLEILGYQTQSQFLLGGGLDKEMENFVELPLEQQVELSGQIKTLTLPGEMGENFKCMGLGRGVSNAPSAFQFADRTQTL
jgi:SAM-dependent MidA family methyltransferase